MTGKGTGPIATIQLFGESAETVIKNIFVSAGKKSQTFLPGKILLGTITNASEPVDQVTVGCIAENNFAIHCHGNPLIVEQIMQILVKNSVKPTTAEQLLIETLSNEKTTIAIEAVITQPKVKTLEGTKIIANQVGPGLTKTADNWLGNIYKIPLRKIKTAAEQILENSLSAKPIIFGCKAVIAGPPNTGKSTLLNCLCGRQKAIVTGIKGTTRDYVSAECRIGKLCVELFDTAGLDDLLTATIEKESQRRTTKILETADLVLLVLDNSRPADQLDSRLIEKLQDKKIITVLNKSDLPARLNTAKLPDFLANTVELSAKSGKKVENLLKKIPKVTSKTAFNLNQPVTFTLRQQNLLEKLTEIKSKSTATSLITELLNGRLRV